MDVGVQCPDIEVEEEKEDIVAIVESVHQEVAARRVRKGHFADGATSTFSPTHVPDFLIPYMP